MSAFFVYIIESPSAPDLYHRRSEGELLMQALRLSDIPSVSRCAISAVAFEAALKIGLKEEMLAYPNLIPILHISCHGSQHGLQISNGDFISWSDLATLLEPINNALNNFLVICMSCCEGYAGIRMAMITEDKGLPYFCLIGSPEKPTWADTAVAFTAFYHRFSKGAHISDAVNAMRVASGINNFFVEWAEQSRKDFLEYIKSFDLSSVTQQLTETANEQAAEELAQQSELEKG